MISKKPGKVVIDSISNLQTQLDALRRSAGISDRSAVLFRADASYADDEVVLVEADGFGGASLLVVAGNYPIDFQTITLRTYKSEDAATMAAEAVLERAGDED